MKKPAKTEGQRRRGRPRKGAETLVTERLLDVATELFLSRGFANTNMDLVALQAGSSKRTLYARFPSKDELFHAVITRFVRQRIDVLQLSVRGTQGLEQTLRAAGEEIVKVTLSPEVVRLHRLVVAEAELFPELTKIIEETAWLTATRFVSDILRNAPPDVRPSSAGVPFLAEQFLALIMGNAFRRVTCGVDQAVVMPDVEDHVRRSVTMFLHGYRNAGDVG